MPKWKIEHESFINNFRKTQTTVLFIKLYYKKIN